MGVFGDLVDSAFNIDAKTRTLADQRMAVCQKCTHFSATKQCTHCGCFMILKTKVKSSTCPIGLW